MNKQRNYKHLPSYDEVYERYKALYPLQSETHNRIYHLFMLVAFSEEKINYELDILYAHRFPNYHIVLKERPPFSRKVPDEWKPGEECYQDIRRYLMTFPYSVWLQMFRWNPEPLLTDYNFTPTNYMKDEQRLKIFEIPEVFCFIVNQLDKKMSRLNNGVRLDFERMCLKYPSLTALKVLYS